MQKEHVICHLKPCTEASPQAYNSDMSAFLAIPREDPAMAQPAEDVDDLDDPDQLCCQWCCHPFEGVPVGAPIRATRDGPIVSGQYCGPSCAAAAIFDAHADNNTAWTRYQMLNDMAGRTVVRAPPRTALRMFGGGMSVAEFRAGQTTIVARQPPLVVENARMEEIPSHHLYRDVYKPLDEERVSQYKVRLSRQRPKTSFFTSVTDLAAASSH